MKKEVILLFVLLLTTLANAQYILDLDVKVIPEILIAPPHQNTIVVNSNIIKLGDNSNERIDVKLSYEIKDEDNNLIDARSSTVALQTSLSISEVFALPNDLKQGIYHVNVKVDYQGYNISKSKQFYVGEKTFLVKLNELINNNLIVFVILLFIIIGISIWRIIHHYYAHHTK